MESDPNKEAREDDENDEGGGADKKEATVASLLALSFCLFSSKLIDKNYTKTQLFERYLLIHHELRIFWKMI